MKLFTEFLDDISLARDEKARLHCLNTYLTSENEKNIDGVFRLLLGYYPKKATKSHELKLWAGELTGYPDWLIDRSVKEVGNFSKALALLLTSNTDTTLDYTINDWYIKISTIENCTEIEIKQFIKNDLCQATPSERELILKLLTGTFKTPVSRKESVMCLSELLNLTLEIVSLRLDAFADWRTICMKDLHTEVEHEDDKIPCTFPEIIPMNSPDPSGNPTSWRAFGHRDGIEAQLIKHGNSVYLWTRDGEIITDKFPEFFDVCKNIDADFVLYGKIVPKTHNIPLNKLTSRLDKLTITKKDLLNAEAVFVIWDVLRFKNDKSPDKTQLVDEIAKHPNIEFYKNIAYSSWDDLTAIHQKCRHHGFSGVILRKNNRPDEYYFWKATSFAIKAILMYVEIDTIVVTGLRSMTFGVFRNEEIVPIAKTSSSLNQFARKQLMEFIKQNTIEKFGPVRTVKPSWVYELHFDSVSLSARRKSGVTLTNPTIHRKIGEEPHLADSIDLLKALI